MLSPVYSIIIPCYNEQEVIQETHRRLTQVMQGMDGDYELIYVNDGSKDQTPLLLNSLQESDSHVRLVHFARNGGHQIAVSAGIDHASGDALVIIDADLQDPPEVIPQMAAKWREGFDVVYGQRRSRKGESRFKKMTADLYYKMLQKLAGDIFPRNTGDFRLVDRRVADVIRSMPEHARYLRGMFAWAGFKQTPLLFDRDKRFAGQTHYPLKKMLKLAADGIISFSDKPLMLPLVLGVLLGAAGGLGFLVLLILLLCGIPGGMWWLADLMTLLTALVLVSLGIEGRYLSRVYEEVKGRPLYVIAETRGFPTESRKGSRQ